MAVVATWYRLPMGKWTRTQELRFVCLSLLLLVQPCPTDRPSNWHCFQSAPPALLQPPWRDKQGLERVLQWNMAGDLEVDLNIKIYNNFPVPGWNKNGFNRTKRHGGGGGFSSSGGQILKMCNKGEVMVR